MTTNTRTASNQDLQELSPGEFVSMLQNDEDLASLQYQIPEIFFQQAKANCSRFIIEPSMTTDRLLNIQVSEPLLEGDSAVNIKLRFVARVDKKYNFVSLEKQGEGEADETENVSDTHWLEGFNSTFITLNESSVEQGLLTNRELRSLISHAKFYDNIPLDNDGLRSAFYKDSKYKKTKMNLTGVKDKEGQFQFLMEVRTNPKTNKPTIGIVVKFWTPGAFHFIGNGNQRVVTLDAVSPVTGWSYKPIKK
jgi:hypothetical protein